MKTVYCFSIFEDNDAGKEIAGLKPGFLL
jgi:hypothetical protein